MLSITIDLDAAMPVYRQIADEIRALIARGSLLDGAELPSVRRLGAAVGVNQNTVAKAYRILADEGLVTMRQGAGARVRVPDHPYRRGVEESDNKRLHDLISRWVLAGAKRADVERTFGEALDAFFAAGPGPAGGKGRKTR
jgi:DNA-binding transcriptional regulator YhcF (GntR family)